MLDLTHVRGFVAVAEELHFGRAAARLNLTQSPLSRQVQMLEHALGVVLLERSSRSVRLTSAGRAFLAEAYRVLEAVGTAERMARQAARGEAGPVRLGFTAASAHAALPRLVSRIRAELPGVELLLEQMVTAEQMEALAARRLDLGLVRPPTEAPAGDARIAYLPLLRERLLLAAPRDHELAAGRRPALRDLDGQPFVTWSPRGGDYFLDLLASLFRAGKVAPRTVQRVNETHTMLALVAAGLGLALVPESARALRPAGVALRPIALPDTARAELLLAWREDDANPALSRLRALAVSVLAGRRDRGGAVTSEA